MNYPNQISGLLQLGKLI